MPELRIDLDWTHLLGFNHASKEAAAAAHQAMTGSKLGSRPAGASADFCIEGLGAKIGSKQWVRLTD